MGSLVGIEKQIKNLPISAQREASDFIEFLALKYRKKRRGSALPEKKYWSGFAETSLKKVWDNEEDDIYNELL